MALAVRPCSGRPGGRPTAMPSSPQEGLCLAGQHQPLPCCQAWPTRQLRRRCCAASGQAADTQPPAPKAQRQQLLLSRHVSSACALLALCCTALQPKGETRGGGSAGVAAGRAASGGGSCTALSQAVGRSGIARTCKRATNETCACLTRRARSAQVGWSLADMATPPVFQASGCQLFNEAARSS